VLWTVKGWGKFGYDASPEGQKGPLCGNHIELVVASTQKDDGQLGREVAKLAAQFEAPINFCSQTNINNGQIWKAGTKGLTRSLLRFVVFYVIPMSLKRVAVVFRNGVLVLDNAN
jgi:hypothetical protein